MLPNPLIDEPVGARSIEVAALLGDSVVDVKHCIDPKSGKITPTTLCLFVAAGALAVIAIVAFAVSVHVAAVNQAALDTWVHVLKRPAFSFRPESLGFAYDWFAFGGGITALITAAAALARMRGEKRSPFYRIGTAPGVELALDSAPAAAFPLVAPSPSGDDFVLTYAAGIEGDLQLDGTTTPLAELASHGRPSARTAGAIELPIPANARIRARSGNATFVISAVPQPRRHAAPLLGNVERRTALYIAGSLAAHLIVLGALSQLQTDDGFAQIDLAEDDDVLLRAANHMADEPPPQPEQTTNGDTGGKRGDNQGAMASLDPAGTAGDPDSTKQGAMKMSGERTTPQYTRAEAIAEARSIGAASIHADSFNNLVAMADIPGGFDDMTVYGANAEGRETGYGSFGTGISGAGRGCGYGCAGNGTIGTGRYGTIPGGRGMHGWDGIGDSHVFGGHKHVAEVPRPIFGEPTGVGDGRDIIRRYMKQNVDKFRYCYEKQVLAHPNIEGEIVVQFFLSESGKVTGPVGSGFDANVASCVADVVGNIEFPRMPGSATVHYPFTFRAPH